MSFSASLFMIEQVAWHKSSSLLTIIFKMHKHYNYLQSKLFTKVIFKMPNRSLGSEFYQERGGARGLRVRFPE
jgi:hypothetical protein